MVLLVKDNNIIFLRSYQFYAVKKFLYFIESTNDLNNGILDLDERSKNLNSYIWHATGSGKTLTSFKIAQLLN